MGIFLNQLIKFYLNYPTNLHHLTTHSTTALPHKMAIVLRPQAYVWWAARMECLEGHSSEFKPYRPMHHSTGSQWSCLRSAVAEATACERRWVTTLASEC